MKIDDIRDCLTTTQNSIHAVRTDLDKQSVNLLRNARGLIDVLLGEAEKNRLKNLEKAREFVKFAEHIVCAVVVDSDVNSKRGQILYEIQAQAKLLGWTPGEPSDYQKKGGKATSSDPTATAGLHDDTRPECGAV